MDTFITFMNFAVMLFCGWVAYICFKDDRPGAGWINLFASSINLASVIARVYQ